MKCIKEPITNKVFRVSDEYAAEMTSQHGWAYCPKHEWKATRKAVQS